MKGVLVTGGTGFVGRHLVHELTSTRASVSVISRSKRDSDDDVQYYSVDVREAENVHKLMRMIAPECVYHLAGVSAAATADSNPKHTYEVNVLGSYNVFEAAMNQWRPAKVLNVSTSYVYAPSAGRLNEKSRTQQEGHYASTKAIAESVASQYRDHASRGIVTVRPFNHSGPGQSPEFVLSSIAMQFGEIEAGERPPVLTLGNVRVRRDFTDVRDVVKAYTALMERGRCGEVYNVCSGKTVSIEEAVEMLRAITRIQAIVEIDSARVRRDDVLEICGDPAKVQGETGWTARIPLEVTLRDLLNYWRQAVQDRMSVKLRTA